MRSVAAVAQTITDDLRYLDSGIFFDVTSISQPSDSRPNIYEWLKSVGARAPIAQRLCEAYGIEVKRVRGSKEGVPSAVEGDVDAPSGGFVKRAGIAPRSAPTVL